LPQLPLTAQPKALPICSQHKFLFDYRTSYPTCDGMKRRLTVAVGVENCVQSLERSRRLDGDSMLTIHSMDRNA